MSKQVVYLFVLVQLFLISGCTGVNTEKRCFTDLRDVKRVIICSQEIKSDSRDLSYIGDKSGVSILPTPELLEDILANTGSHDILMGGILVNLIFIDKFGNPLFHGDIKLYGGIVTLTPCIKAGENRYLIKDEGFSQCVDSRPLKFTRFVYNFLSKEKPEVLAEITEFRATMGLGTNFEELLFND